jgi:hypothetical protein
MERRANVTPVDRRKRQGKTKGATFLTGNIGPDDDDEISDEMKVIRREKRILDPELFDLRRSLPRVRARLKTPKGLVIKTRDLIKKSKPKPVGLSDYNLDHQLEGLPGGLVLTPSETAKYFGDGGREIFGTRAKWISQQRALIQTSNSQDTNKFLFNNEKEMMNQLDRSVSFAPSRGTSRADELERSTASRRARIVSDRLRLSASQSNMQSSLNSSLPSSPSRGDVLKEEHDAVLSEQGSSTESNDRIPVVVTGHSEERQEVSVGGAIDELETTGQNYAADNSLSEFNFFSGESTSLSFGQLTSDKDVPEELLQSLAIEESESDAEQSDGSSGLSHSSDEEISFRNPFHPGTKEFQNGEMVDPSTPRTRFIQNCLKKRLNPRSSYVIRKNLSKKLELQHHGMGDEVGTLFAESISGIPHIHSINLKDNNLTDKSLGPILRELFKIKQLISVNLTKNIMGPVAAKCLRGFLQHPECSLEQLILSDSDVDDTECSEFFDALVGNKSLKYLDMSNNLLGKEENLNTVKPSFETGGEAIARVLAANQCALETLLIGWNMIRLDGAIDLGASLATNNVLTYLDLSFNSIGIDGGLTIADSIQQNKTLRTLLLKNNNIGAVAALTLAVGILENKGLNYIALDGNPIGVEGSKAMMTVPVLTSSRVLVSMRNCNVTMRDVSCWFSFDNILNCYKPTKGSKRNTTMLDMSHPYDRAITIMCCHYVACHHSHVFKYCKLNGKELALEQKLTSENQSYFTIKQHRVLDNLNIMITAASDLEIATDLFHKVDVDGSGELDKEEIGDLLVGLGLDLHEDRINDIMDTYDLDKGGTLGLSEFIVFLRAQARDTQSRIDDILFSPVMTLPGETERWVPPRQGIVSFRIMDGFSTKKHYRTLSSVDRDSIDEVAGSTGDSSAALTTKGLSGFKIRLDEAFNLYFTIMRGTQDKIAALCTLLPQMKDEEDSKVLIKKALGNNLNDLLKLKRAMGASLRPILGHLNGFFQLDLSVQSDRLAISKLMEISNTERDNDMEDCLLKGTSCGDTSQKRNWQGFRNERFHPKVSQPGVNAEDPDDLFDQGEDIEIDVNAGRPLPKQGILCLDFIYTVEPPREKAIIINDEQLCNVLVSVLLLRESDKVVALSKLARWKRQADRSIEGRGINAFQSNLERGFATGKHCRAFHDNLHMRRTELMRAKERESIHNTYEQVEVLDIGLVASPLNADMIIGGTIIGADADDAESLAGSVDMSTLGDWALDSESETEGEEGDGDGNGDNHTNADDHSQAPPLSVAEETVDTSQLEGDMAELMLEGDEADASDMLDLKMRLAKLLTADHKLVSKEAKAQRMLDFLEERLNSFWMLSRHLELIMECFFSVGHRRKTTHFGTYRVELCVALFSRVVDRHNFELVIRALSPFEAACFYERVGWLNVWNPMKPEGVVQLDCGHYEQVRLVNIPYCGWKFYISTHCIHTYTSHRLDEASSTFFFLSKLISFLLARGCQNTGCTVGGGAWR